MKQVLLFLNFLFKANHGVTDSSYNIICFIWISDGMPSDQSLYIYIHMYIIQPTTHFNMHIHAYNARGTCSINTS